MFKMMARYIDAPMSTTDPRSFASVTNQICRNKRYCMSRIHKVSQERGCLYISRLQMFVECAETFDKATGERRGRDLSKRLWLVISQ